MNFIEPFEKRKVKCFETPHSTDKRSVAVIRRMKSKFTIGFLIGILIHLTYGCSVEWTEAIRSGEVPQNEFRETVAVEVRKGLIFLPVLIEGKEYRFLFDSGAPLSISNRLQDDHLFEIVSKGNIVDSDHNKKKVKWAQVDTIHIGGIPFTHQTAFIGDFDANPLLRCLEIDGIIGSNLIRHCNWTIDQKKMSLTLFNRIEGLDLKKGITIPFETDYQYNMFTDINFGQVRIKNVLVDFGSNGSIALNDQIFTTLKKRNIIGETLIEKGMQQSGIVGKTVDLRREIVFSDSVHIDHFYLKKVMLRTGKTVSVGNKLLSRFKITIDWNDKNLHLVENAKIQDSIRLSGFKLGYSANQGVYVQSVLENSNAYNQGIRPSMKAVKLDGLDFESRNDFCDYISHESGDTIFLQVIDSTGHKKDYYIERTNL